jgi:hypothetical protein
VGKIGEGDMDNALSRNDSRRGVTRPIVECDAKRIGLREKREWNKKAEKRPTKEP